MLAAVTQGLQLLGELEPLRFDSGELGIGGFQRSLGDATLGPHRRLAREQLGQGRLGFARHCFGAAEFGSDPGRMRLRIFQAAGNFGALGLDIGNCLDGIALQSFFTLDVAGQRSIEPFEFGQPPSHRVAACPCRRKLVRKAVPLLAQLPELRPFRVEFSGGALMGGLSHDDRLVDALDFLSRRACLRDCRLGGELGFGPASMEQAALDAADLLGQLTIALGRTRLSPQLCGALFLIAEDLRQPGEIGLGRAQLLLGILAARVQPGNARRLFKQETPFDRFGSDHRADFALADERRRMRAGGGIGEQQGDVLGAHVTPVDPVGGARATLNPASDFAFAPAAFLGRIALEQDRDFREIARRPRRSPGEDHVVHAPAAQRLRAGFPHGPADRLEEVGFAAAVRPDNAGQARFNAKFGWLDEALEAAELEPADSQRLLPSPTLTSSPGAALTGGGPP